MKDKLNSVFQALTLLAFLSILVIDHFEQINVPLGVPLIAIIIFVIATAATTDISKQIEPRTKFVRNLIFTIILIAFLIVLYAIGGVSQSGIGIANPLVWVLAVISVGFSYMGYNKTLKSSE